MKLLQRNEVAVAKGIDRKREIDEGVKLVRKVEGLRETYANEEAVYNKWKETALTATIAEIAKKVEERDEIATEVERLKIERAQLLEPLDSEWERLREWEKELVARDFSQDAVSKELDTSFALLEKRNKETEVEDLRVADERERSIKMLGDAQIIHDNANRLAQRVFLAEQASHDAQAEREKRIIERENALIARETTLDTRDAELDERDRTQKDNARAIADRYATLLRTENRYGRQRK